MTAAVIAALILMAALGSLMHYAGFDIMSNAFAAHGGDAIGYFSLGSIALLIGIALIALTGVLLLIWIKSGDW